MSRVGCVGRMGRVGRVRCVRRVRRVRGEWRVRRVRRVRARQRSTVVGCASRFSRRLISLGRPTVWSSGPWWRALTRRRSSMWMTIWSTRSWWARLRSLHGRCWPSGRLLCEEGRVHVRSGRTPANAWEAIHTWMLRQRGGAALRALMRRQRVVRRWHALPRCRMRWRHLVRHLMLRWTVLRRRLRGHVVGTAATPLGTRPRTTWTSGPTRPLHLRWTLELHRWPMSWWRTLMWRWALMLHMMWRWALMLRHVMGYTVRGTGRRATQLMMGTTTGHHHSRSIWTWTIWATSEEFSRMRPRRSTWVRSSHTRIIGSWWC